MRPFAYSRGETLSGGVLGARPDMWYPPSITRAEAIVRLKEHEAELRRLGVERLYMFGSTARDDADEESDVDLFSTIEEANSAPLS